MLPFQAFSPLTAQQQGPSDILKRAPFTAQRLNDKRRPRHRRRDPQNEASRAVLNFFFFFFFFFSTTRSNRGCNGTGSSKDNQKEEMPIMFGKILPTRGAVLVVSLRFQHARLSKEEDEEEEEEEEKRIKEKSALGKRGHVI
jgi:hypothetical protein